MQEVQIFGKNEKKIQKNSEGVEDIEYTVYIYVCIYLCMYIFLALNCLHDQTRNLLHSLFSFKPASKRINWKKGQLRVQHQPEKCTYIMIVSQNQSKSDSILDCKNQKENLNSLFLIKRIRCSDITLNVRLIDYLLRLDLLHKHAVSFSFLFGAIAHGKQAKHRTNNQHILTLTHTHTQT